MEENNVQAQTSELNTVATTETPATGITSQGSEFVTTGSEPVATAEVSTVETPTQVEETPTVQTEVTQETNASVTTPESATVADVTQAPQTEAEKAKEEIQRRRADSYLTQSSNMQNFIDNFDYNPADRGTMWVAGHLTSTQDRLQFLEAIMNEDMYSELDLSKYYFDKNLAVARGYARSKKLETAYGYYQAAQEKALAEAQLTGWYMPAEAKYLLGQWTVAETKLQSGELDNNPTERNRAAAIKDAATKWFAANNITERGIQTLSSLTLEETIRHNKATEALDEREANASLSSAEASLAAANLALRLNKFQEEEEELDMGFDLNGDSYIGHPAGEETITGIDFTQIPNESYTEQVSWWENNFTKGYETWGSEVAKAILDENTYYQKYHEYMYESQQEAFENVYETDGTTVTKDNLQKTNYKINSTKNYGEGTDKNIYAAYDEDGSVRLYIFDNYGVAHQITTSDDIVYAGDGTKIDVSTMLSNNHWTLSTNNSDFTITDSNGNEITMNIGNKKFSEYDIDINKYSNINGEEAETVEKYQEKGYKLCNGARSLDNFNNAIVMYDEANDKYYEVNGNKLKQVDSDDIVFVDIETINADGTFTYKVTNVDGTEVTGYRNWDINKTDDYEDVLATQSYAVGTYKNGNTIWAYTDRNNNTIYYSAKVDYSKTIYGSSQIWMYTKTYMTKSEAAEYIAGGVDSLDSYESEISNYINSQPSDNTYKGNAQTIADSKEGSTPYEADDKDPVTISSGNSTSSRSSESSSTSTEDQVVTTSSKEVTDEDEKPEYTTLDLGEKAKEEQEKQKEKMLGRYASMDL